MKSYSKNITLLLISLIAMIAVSHLSSCGDDDGPNGSSIVGSWTCSKHYYGGSDTYTFKKNGTFSWTYSGTADWFDDESGTYTFNGSMLTLTNKRGFSWIYMVVGLSDSSVIFIDEDGDKYTYYKK